MLGGIDKGRSPFFVEYLTPWDKKQPIWASNFLMTDFSCLIFFSLLSFPHMLFLFVISFFSFIIIYNFAPWCVTFLFIISSSLIQWDSFLINTVYGADPIRVYAQIQFHAIRPLAYKPSLHAFKTCAYFTTIPRHSHIEFKRSQPNIIERFCCLLQIKNVIYFSDIFCYISINIAYISVK